MPVVLRAVVKPTPSIAKAQQTVDVAANAEAILEIHGRHDPCILPRARAVADAVTAFGILDLCCQRAGTLWQREGWNGGI
jgi:chorismate synthase